MDTAPPLMDDKRPEPPGTIISTQEQFVAAELKRISDEEVTDVYDSAPLT